MLGFVPYVELFPSKGCIEADIIETRIRTATKNSRHMFENRENSSETLHRKTDRLSMHHQSKCMRHKDSNKTDKENSPQKLFEKSKHPTNKVCKYNCEKYCKECKNFRTIVSSKLKETEKLDEQIAENRKLIEKGEVIANYVSKFISLIGLGKSNSETIPNQKHCEPTITKINRLPKQILPMKSKPNFTQDDTVELNNFISSVILTDKGIEKYDGKVNKTTENYSIHSLEKYKTKPTNRKDHLKRIKHENVEIIKENIETTKKKIELHEQECFHTKEKRNVEKRLAIETVKMSDHKRKRDVPFIDNEPLMSVKTRHNKTNTHKKSDKNEKELKKNSKLISNEFSDGCRKHKSKHDLKGQSLTKHKLLMSNSDKKVSKVGLKNDLKQPTKIDNRKLCKTSDKVKKNSQHKIKMVAAKCDITIVNKSNLEKKTVQEESKDIIISKLIFLDKNGDVNKYTYKPGKIVELEEKAQSSIIVAKDFTELAKADSLAETTESSKNDVTYPTILWPPAFNIDLEDDNFEEFFDAICNFSDDVELSSMDKLNNIIIPASDLLKKHNSFYDSCNSGLHLEISTNSILNITSNHSRHVFLTLLNDYTKSIGNRNSFPIFKTASFKFPATIKYEFGKRISRSKSVPFNFLKNMPETTNLVSLKKHIRSLIPIPVYTKSSKSAGDSGKQETIEKFNSLELFSKDTKFSNGKIQNWNDEEKCLRTKTEKWNETIPFKHDLRTTILSSPVLDGGGPSNDTREGESTLSKETTSTQYSNDTENPSSQTKTNNFERGSSLTTLNRRKMIRTRSEMNSIEAFYRRYRRTSSLPPPNVSNTNLSGNNSNLSLTSNSKQYSKNISSIDDNDQKYDESRTRGGHDKFQKTNKSNSKKNNANNNSTNPSKRTLKTNNDSIPSTSAKTSFEIEYEKHLDARTTRHTEHLKQEHETKRNVPNNLEPKIEQKNILLKSQLKKDDFKRSSEMLKSRKIRFSDIPEIRKISSKTEKILRKKSKLRTRFSDDESTVEVCVEKPIESSNTRTEKLTEDVKETADDWREIMNKYKNMELNQRKYEENVKELKKFHETSSNITVSCDYPLPIDTKVTVSFERNNSPKTVLENQSTKVNTSEKKIANDLEVKPTATLKSSSRTSILRNSSMSFIESLQKILQRELIPTGGGTSTNTNAFDELETANGLNEHFDKLSKKLIDTLTELTTKTSDLKKKDLEELIQNYNKEVTIEFFNIISKSTEQLVSSMLSLTKSMTSMGTYSPSQQTIDDPIEPSKPSNYSDKPSKRVRIKLSKESQTNYHRSMPIVQSSFAQTDDTSTVFELSQSVISGERSTGNATESFTDIDTEILKRKHKARLEMLAKQLPKPPPSEDPEEQIESTILVVDSIVLNKKHMHRLSERNVLIESKSKVVPPTTKATTPPPTVPPKKVNKKESSSFEERSSYLGSLHDFQVSSRALFDNKSVKDHTESLLDIKEGYPISTESSPHETDDPSLYLVKPIQVTTEGTPEYLKHSNVDLHKATSELILVESNDVIKPEKPASIESLKSTGYSVVDYSHDIFIESISPPSRIGKKAQNLQKIDIVDNSASLTDNQKFSLLLNSYTVLKDVVEKASVSELSAGLPKNVSAVLKENMVQKKVPGSSVASTMESSLSLQKKVLRKRSFEPNNTVLKPNRQFAVTALFDSPSPSNELLQEPEPEIPVPQKATRKESEIRDTSSRYELLIEDPLVQQTIIQEALIQEAIIEEEIIEEAILQEATSQEPIIKERSTSQKDKNCKCTDKQHKLTETILQKAKCQCIKQKNDDGTIGKCACVSITEEIRPIRVVCGHLDTKMEEHDKCRCKTGENYVELENISELDEFSAFIKEDQASAHKSESSMKIDLDPETIGACFRRGFRADNVALSGAECLLKDDEDKLRCIRSNLAVNTKRTAVNFSERRTALDFLIALGFSVDEASMALRNEIVKNRLSAAITEARVWCNFVTIPEGTLLYLLAYKAKMSTMRYFLQIVEAIINNRIPDAVQLDGFIQLLDKLESGHLPMLLIFGTHKTQFDEDDGKLVQQQLQKLFVNMFRVAQDEANKLDRVFTQHDTQLLEHLTTYYRPGLYPHLELIAKYVGRGKLVSVVQMEAAIIYLSRLNTKHVDLDEFETYCGMAAEKKDSDSEED